MYFKEAKDCVEKVLDAEKVYLNNDIKNKLYSLLSKFCNYEEEEAKIQPQLFVGYDVEYFFNFVPGKIVSKVKNLHGQDNFEKVLKTLLPLSNIGVSVFIELKGDIISYGFFRAEDNLTISVDELIFNDVDLGLLGERALIKFTYQSNSNFCIRGVRGTKELVSFNLIEPKKQNGDIVSFLIKKYDKEKNLLIPFWDEYVKLLRKKVHGCICVFCNKDDVDKKFLNSGIVLSEPISLSERVFKYKNSNNYVDLIKLNYNVELTLSLINNDGITVFDEFGNLIAYNVFVKSQTETLCAGGARRRAVESIKNSPPMGCKGVYFQSQDGDSFFEEIDV